MDIQKINKKDKPEETLPPKAKPLVCGLVMPISALDGCTAEHWSDVKAIIAEAVESVPDPKFNVKIVSDADEVGVIQKRIVQNIYSADIVVCDVSGKNPNVMFELGMRLAFDKPTVIVKDDKTDYAFDTGIIEHVPYPRDLRFNRMVTFKAVLAAKVLASYKAAKENPDHSTFLKNFGKFHVATLSEDVIPADKLVFEMLSDLQTEVSRIRRTLPRVADQERRGKLSEATSRMYAALASYFSKNPKTTVSDLVGNEAFYDEMERKCKAPQYFDDRNEFVESLDQIIREFLQV